MRPAQLGVCAVLALAGTGSAQNLWAEARHPRALIADHRASQIGDILTVTINEAHKIKNEDKVDRSNQTNLAARLEDFTLSDKVFANNVLPKVDVRQARSMVGDAKQEQDSSVQASVAVIVVDVQPNGNLVVAGQRLVVVDDEEKTLRISGIVRPLDIDRSNRVNSMNVADARVAITGTGGNTRMTTRGPVGTLFDTLIWAAWPF